VNFSIIGLLRSIPAISTVLTRPVSTAPGQTRLTRMPWRRRSKRLAVYLAAYRLRLPGRRVKELIEEAAKRG
jgi:hypothetical protein